MDYNLIQRPDLILKIADFFGIRQAHLVPSLNEGIQVVYIAGDVRDEKQSNKAPAILHGRAAVNLGATALFNAVRLRNPAASRSVLIVDDLFYQTSTDVDVGLTIETGDLAGGAFSSLATNSETWAGGTHGWYGAPILPPKLAGQVSYASNVGQIIVSNRFLWLQTTGAGLQQLQKFEGLSLVPGTQLTLAHLNGNASMMMDLHWHEQPIV
jgi:hypothetical protein